MVRTSLLGAWVLLLLKGRCVAEAQETNDNEEIAVLYEQALTLYDVFPPMGRLPHLPRWNTRQ